MPIAAFSWDRYAVPFLLKPRPRPPHPYPQRLKSNKPPVTLAAGFLCEDGIVICADREVTTDFEKYEESKIFTVNSDSNPSTPTAIIAGSGWLNFVKMAVDDRPVRH